MMTKSASPRRALRESHIETITGIGIGLFKEPGAMSGDLFAYHNQQRANQDSDFGRIVGGRSVNGYACRHGLLPHTPISVALPLPVRLRDRRYGGTPPATARSPARPPSRPRILEPGTGIAPNPATGVRE